MFKTEVTIGFLFQNFGEETGNDNDFYDQEFIEHTFEIQEREKSFYNPQERFVSNDLQIALEEFCITHKNDFVAKGFNPLSDKYDFELLWIDGSGDDTNI